MKGSIYGAARSVEKKAQAKAMSKTKRRLKVKRRGKKAC